MIGLGRGGTAASWKPCVAVLLAAMVAGLVAIAVAEPASSAARVRVTISPKVADPGAIISTTGSGFPARARGNITFSGRTVATFRTSAAGRFTKRWRVPADARSGTVRAKASSRRASATLQIRQPAPAPAPTPAPAPAPAPPPPSDAAPATEAVFVGAGDIADGNNDNDAATAALLRNIPGTVFTAGDNAYNSGSLSEYNSYYEPTWGSEKYRTKPIPGNHEYVGGTAASQNGAGYFDYFGAVAARGNAGSYSFNLGDWHVVALNTGQCHGAAEADGSTPRCGPGDPMLEWLKADLQANQNRCTMALFHHPRWSSGKSHGDEPSPSGEIVRTLYDHGVEVGISGHDHHYERFAPQDPSANRDDARGIRQFIVGTGGRALNQIGTVKPNSEVRNTSTHGVIKFTLKPGEYDWEFVPVKAGLNTDSGTAQCH